MKINPKNFFKRKIEEIPINWVTATINVRSDYQESILSEWIYKNCNGRFCIKKDVHYAKDGVRPITKIGFEIPSDLTLFHLGGKAQELY